MSDNHTEEPSSTPRKRAYRGRVQAEVAALTKQRIIEAGLALFDEQWGETITLEQIAGRADVTVQTLLRHFGSKEQLSEAVSQEAFRLSQQQLSEPPPGDIASIAAILVVYYDVSGRRILRGLAQEQRYPELHAIIDLARATHRAWIERAFAPFLTPLDTSGRTRLLAQLFTLTGAYTWHMLRHECNLSNAETVQALQEMLAALLATRSAQSSD